MTAFDYLPPDPLSRLDHAGTYRRELPVSLERMYENTLDWEHLPHQHASTFKSIACVSAGGWGWRARTCDHKGRESLLELKLDRSCQRWITTNLEGSQAGAEIWTHVFVQGPRRLQINVDFFIPGIAPEHRQKVGEAYARQYTVLYDEDVAMMAERQTQLDRRTDSIHREEVLTLGAAADQPDRQNVDISGRHFVVARGSDGWVCYPAACPHQLGPLGDLEGRIARCSWHGYGFDVYSGECVTGQACRLGQRPRVLEDGGVLRLAW